MSRRLSASEVRDLAVMVVWVLPTETSKFAPRLSRYSAIWVEFWFLCPRLPKSPLSSPNLPFPGDPKRNRLYNELHMEDRELILFRSQDV